MASQDLDILLLCRYPRTSVEGRSGECLWSGYATTIMDPVEFDEKEEKRKEKEAHNGCFFSSLAQRMFVTVAR